MRKEQREEKGVERKGEERRRDEGRGQERRGEKYEACTGFAAAVMLWAPTAHDSAIFRQRTHRQTERERESEVDKKKAEVERSSKINRADNMTETEMQILGMG